MVQKVGVNGFFFLVSAITLLFVPLKWVVSAWLAAIFHECCHWVGILLCGGEVCFLEIGACGIRMTTAPMGRGRELICALLGPLGSLTLTLFAQWIPEIAICGLIQGLYNLLPIYPLDGGRIIRCMFPQSALPGRNKVLAGIRWMLGAVLLAFGFCIHPILILLIFPAVIKGLFRKFACKEEQLALQ